MTIWQDIKEILLKTGDSALIKAEIITQMGKCRIAAKNRESEIDKILIEIGNYTVTQIEKKQSVIEEDLKEKIEAINNKRMEIEELNLKYTEAKSRLKGEEKQGGGNDGVKGDRAE